jgi:hypothetical protein
LTPFLFIIKYDFFHFSRLIDFFEQSFGLLVPMRVREAAREERTSPVLVNVTIEADSHAASRQQLMCFQMTDESDPFFLYSLRITEEEFQVESQHRADNSSLFKHFTTVLPAKMGSDATFVAGRKGRAIYTGRLC